jgi:hypothetical protein
VSSGTWGERRWRQTWTSNMRSNQSTAMRKPVAAVIIGVS